MDILFYDKINQELKNHNEKYGKPYGNEIVPHAVSQTHYPHTVFQEIRNTTNTQFNSPHDRVASVGYRIDVYAKDKNTLDRETIARQVAYIMDKFFTNRNVPRVSFNVMFEGQNQSICHIIMMYDSNLSEFRRNFI